MKKNVLQMLGAGFFGFALVFIFMKITEQPEITFTTLPSGEKIIWEAKDSDGQEMSIKAAQDHIDKGGRYVETYHTISKIGHDRFGMDLKPHFGPIPVSL